MMSTDRWFVTQPKVDGSYVLLDAHAFRNAVSAHMAGDDDAAFVLAIFRSRDPRDCADLGERVLGGICFDDGDLAGRIEDAVALYVHGESLDRFRLCASQLRADWRTVARSELDVQHALYPDEEDDVIALLSGDWSSPRRIDARSPETGHDTDLDGIATR